MGGGGGRRAHGCPGAVDDPLFTWCYVPITECAEFAFNLLSEQHFPEQNSTCISQGQVSIPTFKGVMFEERPG